MNSFLVGLSSGTACLAFCTPAILPYILYKDIGTRKNYILLIKFLTGRLMGYLIFGLMAFYLGKIVVLSSEYKPVLMGIAYIIIASVLIYEFIAKRRNCSMKIILKMKDKEFGSFIIGFATGINMCPSFLLIFTDAINAKSLLDSLTMFFSFFIGTSIYFLPLPLVGSVKQKEIIKSIVMFLIIIMGIYYFYKGLILIYNFGRFK